MSDEQPEPTVEPISFTQAVVLTVSAWPQRTSFGERLLAHPHQYHARMLDGDVLEFTLFNGGAQYHLRRDLPPDGENVVADLVPDSDTVTRRKP